MTLAAGFIHKGEAVPTITRLRPKQHDRTAEAIQRVLELPLQLSPDVRAQLSSALSSYSPEPWYFIMLNREQGLAIQRKINEGPRPGVTLNVWMAVLGYTEYGTGEIQATRKQLALQAGTTAAEVSRALSRLVEIGALIRTDRGRYALNPRAAWAGSLASREQAAAGSEKPELQLVEPA